MAGGGRNRRKRVKKPKDHHSSARKDSSDSAELAEELTALSAIFEEDFKLISQKDFTEFSITLRSQYSLEFGPPEASAELFVRCLPGYPCKPPKLQLKAKGDLPEEELNLLHSMLLNQAASIAREGRVMIFNLVEAAQEFLSEHIKSHLLQKQQVQENIIATPVTMKNGCVSKSTEAAFKDLHVIELSDVFCSVDLFAELGGTNDASWIEDSPASSVHPHISKSSMLQKKLLNVVDSVQRPELSDRMGIGQHQPPEVVTLLNKEAKEIEALKLASPDSKLKISEQSTVDSEILITKDFSYTSISELVQKLQDGISSSLCKGPILAGKNADCNGNAADSDEERVRDESILEDDLSTIRRDFIMAHLLRLVCCAKGPLPHALSMLAPQLRNLALIPKWTEELLIHQPHLFDKAFHHLFNQYSRETDPDSETYAATETFWRTSPELWGNEESSSSVRDSRYLNDFEELTLLGKGRFGHVLLCKNKIDGRLYAIKKIRLKDGTPLNTKILREVATLSRLQHQHVVRYYQAWFDTGYGNRSTQKFDAALDDFASSSSWMFSAKIDEEESSFREPTQRTGITPKEVHHTYLYIQMEYCPRTLKQVLGSYRNLIDKDVAWHIFRQTVEGLAHIHGQGIIHRDLNPSNIFFDARNDIKIGDFGLAKFTNLEQSERDPLQNLDTTCGSLDGTGQVGTYFYTAPEIDQCWPHIDEKVDMYSLGVILFELWHPFSTAMERHFVLTDLKHKRLFPSKWASEYPHQAALVQRLMDLQPSERPSAMQVLRNELPPRMEDEVLDDILRTIHSAESSSFFDRIIAAIFDEEGINTKAQSLGKESHYSTTEVDFQDRILEIAKEVFVQHGAHQFETCSFKLVDGRHFSNRGTSVKLLNSAGSMLELRREMRIPFAHWIAANQRSNMKRFEISKVYRHGVGHSAPYEFCQADFDIVGGAAVLVEAEIIKVAVDVISKSCGWETCEIRLNHSSILDAIWSWSGVKPQERRDVAKLLGMISSAPPQSPFRKSQWVLIRRQLLQGLQLSEHVVDRLQTVERRLSGCADESLARLRGALPANVSTSAGIDELSTLLIYLRMWHLEEYAIIDALMAPSEEYYRGILFQVYMPKECSIASSIKGTLLATGGRYDQLIEQLWPKSLTSSAPGAVGLSIALEKLFFTPVSDSNGSELVARVLVCSKGGGGLLKERMEIVADLWAVNIKAEFVSSPAPSLTEQYEYAHDNGIKWLVIMTDAGLCHTGAVKVRHLDLKVEEDVPREGLVKFFTNLPVTPMAIRKKAALLREGN